MNTEAAGRGRELTPEQRALLLDIRRVHTGASVPLILRTLMLRGGWPRGLVSESTVTRLHREAELPRGVRLEGHRGLRWQADRPQRALARRRLSWPALRVGQITKPLRIQVLLDDASRHVVALEAHHTEREDDMLGLMLGALRRHGAPDALPASRPGSCSRPRWERGRSATTSSTTCGEKCS